MRLIPVEEIGQELQGGIYIRVEPERQVSPPFLQVEVRAHKREETGHRKAWGKGHVLGKASALVKLSMIEEEEMEDKVEVGLE